MVVKKLQAAWQRLIKPSVLACGAIVLFCAAFVLCTLALNAGSEDKTSDWLSAFGTVFGAGLTGGALLIAAMTYKHQVDEKTRAAADARQAKLDARRAPAKAVQVRKVEDGWGHYACFVRNNGERSIDALFLVAANAEGVETIRHTLGSVAPGAETPGHAIAMSSTDDSYIEFQDSDGIAWKKYFDNRLEERVPSAADDEPATNPAE